MMKPFDIGQYVLVQYVGQVTGVRKSVSGELVYTIKNDDNLDEQMAIVSADNIVTKQEEVL